MAYGTFLIDGDGHRIKIRGKRDAFLRDDYITAFMRGLIFRDSCYTCTYAGPRRCSDITIADFWGLNRCSVPQANGVSLLLINTEKGMALANDSLRDTLCEERRFLKRHRIIAAIDSRCPILSMLVGKAIYEYSKR